MLKLPGKAASSTTDPLVVVITRHNKALLTAEVDTAAIGYCVPSHQEPYVVQLGVLAHSLDLICCNEHVRCHQRQRQHIIVIQERALTQPCKATKCMHQRLLCSSVYPASCQDSKKPGQPEQLASCLLLQETHCALSFPNICSQTFGLANKHAFARAGCHTAIEPHAAKCQDDR